VRAALLHVARRRAPVADACGLTGTRVALKKLFQFLHQTTQALADIPCAETAFRLFLQCAQAASDCKQEPVAYEFMERAFEIFEESIPGAREGVGAPNFRVPCLSPIPPTLADSKAQVTALQLIVGSLQRCTVFGTENRAALVHKATGYSAKLLKKPDQCRAVYMCAHLFWHDTVQELCDAASVLQCLKRALKIANAAQVRTKRTGCGKQTPSPLATAPDIDDCNLCPYQQMAGSAKDAGPAGLFIEILNKCVLRCPDFVAFSVADTALPLGIQIPVFLRQGLREHHGRGAAEPAATGGG
jgi:Vacuolar protein sorting-associated protein 35